MTEIKAETGTSKNSGGTKMHYKPLNATKTGKVLSLPHHLWDAEGLSDLWRCQEEEKPWPAWEEELRHMQRLGGVKGGATEHGGQRPAKNECRENRVVPDHKLNTSYLRMEWRCGRIFSFWGLAFHRKLPLISSVHSFIWCLLVSGEWTLLNTSKTGCIEMIRAD